MNFKIPPRFFLYSTQFLLNKLPIKDQQPKIMQRYIKLIICVRMEMSLVHNDSLIEHL